MAVRLTEVVVDDPNSFIKGVLESDVSFDFMEREERLKGLEPHVMVLRSQYGVPAAAFFTREINLNPQRTATICKVYDLAQKTFLGKAPMGYEPELGQVSVFSKKPLEEALKFKKDSLFSYHVLAGNPPQEELVANLHYFVLHNDAFAAYGLLSQMKGKVTGKKFVETQLKAFAEQMIEPEISSFECLLALVKYNQIGQLINPEQSLKSQKELAQIVHSFAKDIVDSIHNKISEMSGAVKRVKEKAVLQDVAGEIEYLVCNMKAAYTYLAGLSSIQVAKPCLSLSQNGMQSVFEIDNDSRKTGIACMESILEEVNQKLLSASEPSSKRKR